jgi:hypothetical protein
LICVGKAVEITFRGRGVWLLTHVPVLTGDSLQDITVLSRGGADHVFGHRLSRDRLRGRADGDRRAPIRAGCEWKSVIGYSRFDDIKDLAIGNRYAVLMGKPFE